MDWEITVAAEVAGAGEHPRLAQHDRLARLGRLGLLEMAIRVKKMWWLPRMLRPLNSLSDGRAIKTGVE